MARVDIIRGAQEHYRECPIHESSAIVDLPSPSIRRGGGGGVDKGYHWRTAVFHHLLRHCHRGGFVGIRVYVGQRFQHGHERRAFGRFLKQMYEKYAESSEPYYIIAEAQINGAAIDLLVLTHTAIIVIDLKELTQVEEAQKNEVTLHGGENGAWEYRLTNGFKCPLGGREKQTNPYQQMDRFRYSIADWIASHSQIIFGRSYKREEVLNQLFGWIAISPGYAPQSSRLDLPRNNSHVRRWFKVLPLDALGQEVQLVPASRRHFSEAELERFLKKMGVTPVENIQEFLPDYVSPTTSVSLFSEPYYPRALIDRQKEREGLIAFLNDASAPILYLGGTGGIGKTELVGWLTATAADKGFRRLWVDCKRGVTLQSLLAAIERFDARAHKRPILVRQRDLQDQLEAALNVLGSDPTLLVFEDYHHTNDASSEMSAFFLYVARHASQLRVVLTTRERPLFLDQPTWPSGGAKEIQIPELPAQFLHTYIQERDSLLDLSETELQTIARKTGRNPYAVNLVITLLKRNSALNLDSLPLYSQGDIAKLLEELFVTISEQAYRAARAMAVIRTRLNSALIAQLTEVQSKAEIPMLVRELVESYQLRQVDGVRELEMNELVRDYLYSKLSDTECKRAHNKAALYYQEQAAGVYDQRVQMEYLYEAIYHLHQAGHHTGLLSIAPQTYELLQAHGDFERASRLTDKALVAATHCEDPIATQLWQLHQAIQQGLSEYLKRGYQEALRKFEWARNTALTLGEQRWVAVSLYHTGRVERHLEQYDQAEASFSEARKLASEVDDAILVCDCLSHLALIARHRKDLHLAEFLFYEAYEMAEKLDYVLAQEINYGHLADIQMERGDYQAAEREVQRCIELSREFNFPLSIRINLGRMAEIKINLGHYKDASVILDELQPLCVQAQDLIGEAWTLKRRGELAAALGEKKEAKQYIRQGIKKLHEKGNKSYIAQFEQALAAI